MLYVIIKGKLLDFSTSSGKVQEIAVREQMGKGDGNGFTEIRGNLC